MSTGAQATTASVSLYARAIPVLIEHPTRPAMRDWTRREFLAASALAAAAQDAPRKPERPDAAPPDRPARVGPNEQITLGFIGTGGMGTGLINIFKKFPQVRIAAVCDVHEPHLLRAKSEAGGAPETY